MQEIEPNFDIFNYFYILNKRSNNVFYFIEGTKGLGLFSGLCSKLQGWNDRYFYWFVRNGGVDYPLNGQNLWSQTMMATTLLETKLLSRGWKILFRVSKHSTFSICWQDTLSFNPKKVFQIWIQMVFILLLTVYDFFFLG